MALGQLENRLTVVVQYPNGTMRVHLHEVLTRTGARCKVPVIGHDGAIVGYKSIVDYPLSYCRKLFKFMVQWSTEEDLGQVDQFIRENNEKLYKEWVNQRELGGR